MLKSVVVGNVKKIVCVTLACMILTVDGRERDRARHDLKGNLALPTSQQPGSLFGFGQNIVDTGDIQAFAFIESLGGKRRQFTDELPALLYGINDAFSLLAIVPVIQFKLDNKQSSGVGDLFLQGEYAFYNKDTRTYANQATFVANISLPTGSASKELPTGFGAPSFFLGATFSHMAIDWYLFSSAGAQLPVANGGTKFGNQFLYQGGIAKNISYKSEKWIFSWMLETFGLYSQRNKMKGAIDCNSGSNIIFVGPSLWFSTRRLIMQGGVALPVWQHLFGKQNKNYYLISANIGWKFN